MTVRVRREEGHARGSDGRRHLHLLPAPAVAVNARSY